jgi:hypothetical protein
MKSISTILCLVLTFSSFASEIEWLNDSVHELDIDCDGISEKVFYGTIGNDFVVKIKPSSASAESSLQFGLGQGSRQDAICGLHPEFSVSPASTEQMHKDMFEQTINGYRYSSQCSDLDVSGGECDPITIFYNHQTKELNWWRL